VLVAAGRHDGHVTVWDANSGVEMGAFDTDGLATACAVPTVDGYRLVIDGNDGVDLYDVRSGTRTGSIDMRESFGATLMCAIRSYGRDLLVTANGDEDVTRTWDIVKGEQWASLGGHDGPVLHICAVPLSDDPLGDQVVATAVTGGQLTVWDPTTGEAVTGDLEHDGEAYGLFSAKVGGRHVLGANDQERVLRLWDPRTGEQVCEQPMPYIVQDAVQGGEHLLVQHPDGLAGWRIQVGEA
jgi:WD40 repeat protein